MPTPTVAREREAILRDPPSLRVENSWITRVVKQAEPNAMKWHCIVFPRDEKQERWLSGVRGADIATKHPSNASSTKSHMANGVYGDHVEVWPDLILEQAEDGKLYTHLYFRINPNTTKEN